jgi:membrane protein DedA with SNARE-associated domain
MAWIGDVAQWVQHYGYAGVFVLLTLGILGLPVPDEWLLTFSGYLVYRRNLQLVPTVISCFLGAACGISLSYVIGRTAGSYGIAKYGSILHVTENRLEQVHRWFGRIGSWSLVVGYFIPGVRHLTAVVAGTTQLAAPRFMLFAYGGALLWSTTFVMVGYAVGEKWESMLGEIEAHLRLGILALIAAAVLILLFLRKKRML